MNTGRWIAIVWSALTLCALLALTAAPAARAEPEATLPGITALPDVEAFVREGCPHCARAKEFLVKLQKERPDLRIVIRDVERDPDALSRLRDLSAANGSPIRVPSFLVRADFLVGFSDEATTGQIIRDAAGSLPAAPGADDDSKCGTEGSSPCEDRATESPPAPDPYAIEFLGRKLSVEQIGLPLFTLAMGMLDGFNPCSMWVLLLMISLLAPLNDRRRMLAIAGTFIAVEGLAYFLFMAAWLNLFLFIGLSRVSELVIAVIALMAGSINIKDFLAFGRGFSLSIPDSAKPGIYARMRAILHAESMTGAIVGAFVLGVLVQIVEFMCTSGFPALYTRILTLHRLEGASYYGYLLLYNLAYMLDDLIILSIGVITLSQHRLQEREGQWLKLVSGLVMIGLGLYLILRTSV
jgi:glutaredoxin